MSFNMTMNKEPEKLKDSPFDVEELQAMEVYVKFKIEHLHYIMAEYGPVIRERNRMFNAWEIENPEMLLQESFKLQYELATHNHWQPFEAYLKNIGERYAEHKIRYHEIIDTTALYSHIIQNIIRDMQREHPEKSKMYNDVWDGYHQLTDYTVRTLSNAYFERWQELERIEKGKVARYELDKERFSALCHNTTDYILIVNKDHIVTYINHVSPGLKKSDVIGHKIDKYNSEQEKPMIDYHLNLVFQTGAPTIYETHYDRDGEIEYLMNSVAPIFKNNEVEEVAIISRDFTSLKNSELELKKLNEELEDIVAERTRKLETINKELESFSYSVSHDLRAPLRAISGFSTVLLKSIEGKLNEQEKRYFNIIMDNAVQMGTLIDDLLAFSRLGRTGLNMISFDMVQLVNNVYQEIIQSFSEEEKAQIDLQVKDMPEACADRKMFKQVVSNLLGNAIKYSKPKDKIHIEAGGEINEDKVVYYIKDNGVGFDMAYAHKLFGIFQRLHSNDEFEGTGIGLALVQRIIDKHEGEVWAESTIGEGSIFYYSIPKNVTD